MKDEVQFDEGVRKLAAKALQIIDNDSKDTSLSSMKSWAEKLAQDCVSKDVGISAEEG